ncbi:hypothetical protein NXS19_007789 [Fusarium pseudograminearum]|nr:hypothetical protein NXS19_007789 [Fusarium pseudograminearum]
MSSEDTRLSSHTVKCHEEPSDTSPMLNRFIYDTSSFQDRLLRIQLCIEHPHPRPSFAGSGLPQRDTTLGQSRL